eukprot:CAMPEP_0201534154 /NCGR_PEP_ID=MMETSP0161_2-20130828/55424_1 /ASSEMBLY_ACC=CAM_ASM_000251 /TAXON_ID=180227 /ORGANISM="Neoparamoeba aestuarina, Strain SoJaBio B1-5/56/2" /LENGTH=122 /DNA_ID=CAMNT_0047938645 /DNA_START=90 /DNA_END=459 /DNA_ORIENTATION=+
MGFNVQTVQYKSIRFDMWDIGGQDAFLPLWEHYYNDADALICVIDSHDKPRISDVRDILRRLLDDRKSIKVPLLVFCNKQDIVGSLSAERFFVSFPYDPLLVTDIGSPKDAVVAQVKAYTKA